MSENRHRSVGQMISTASFVFVSLWLANSARGFEGPVWKLVGIWVASGLCMAGAFRFHIGALVERFRSDGE